MSIALLADIHANREALTACLNHARARGATDFVFLGDYVGYGAEPLFAVECVAEHVAKGAIAVMGNHDSAVLEPSVRMNDTARIAIEWTRNQLDAGARTFLDRLPLAVGTDDRLYVHGDASAPSQWNYVLDTEDAALSLNSTRARLTVCGHVHVPALYGMSQTGKLTRFRPIAGTPIPLLRQRRWLAVLGSVGQPRDGSCASSYALFREAAGEITFERVPYDVETAAAKIRAAGLPDVLAQRLRAGR